MPSPDPPPSFLLPPKPPNPIPRRGTRNSGRTSRFLPGSVAPIMVTLPNRTLGSSLRSLERQRPVHEILGGGIIADVILWRRKDVTVAILLGALGSWVVFQVAEYSLVSLVSNVLLLLISILFLWAKAARIFNRPPPPVPKMYLPEETVHKAAVLVHAQANMVLSAFNDIVQRKDSRIFYTIAFSLWLISLIGGMIKIVTLGYASLLIILTVPALYDKYQEYVDRYLKSAQMEVQLYERVYIVCFCKYFNKSQKGLSEFKKLVADT